MAQSPLGGEPTTYVVKKGDGLYAVARSLGLAYPAIARANGIENVNSLFTGDTLTMPTRYILPANPQNGVIINLPECRLYYFREGELKAVYPVAIGLPTWQTPIGAFSVVTKVENPAWYMPPEMAERENVKREIIEAGPDNPLGDFWIGTSIKHTGIHGTNQPMSIGRALSHGCIRMYPEHIDSLFREVAVGDSGDVLYEPVKVSLDGDSIWIEVHPDVYEKGADLAQIAKDRLRALGVWDTVNPQMLEKALAEERGIPVSLRVK